MKRELGAVGIAAACSVLLGFAHLVPRYDCLVVPVAIWFAFRLLDGVKGRALFWIITAMSTLLAFGVLAHLWTTGHEGRSTVLDGIIPWSDARGFTSDAERLVHGLKIDESSRRSLYVAVAGAVLRWSGNDLRVMLVLSTAAYGLALGYMSYETTRAHGRICGCFVFVIGFFWVRRFTGFVATEALAFPLGALAFGLLVRTADTAVAVPRRAAIAFAAGMLVLTLALTARPGPLLVIPGLLAWSLYAFRGKARLRAIALGTAGVIVAVLASRTLSSHLALGATFRDYPEILYALVHRSDLHSAMNDHPELQNVGGDERVKAVTAILVADVKRDPTLLFLGPADALFSFIVGPHGFFSFVWTNPDDHVLEDAKLMRRIMAERGYLGPLAHWVHELGARSLVNAGVMGAMAVAFTLSAIAGIGRLVKRRHGRRYSLALFVMGSVLASSVFTPTWIGEGMQMQSAVFAFVPYAIFLGLGAIRRQPHGPPARPLVIAGFAVPAAGAALIIATVLWPLRLETAACTPGTLSLALLPSTRVIVRSTTEPPLSQNLKFIRKRSPELVAAVSERAKPGDVLEFVYDACAERAEIAIGSQEALPPTKSWHTVRAEPLDAGPYIINVSPP